MLPLLVQSCKILNRIFNQYGSFLSSNHQTFFTYFFRLKCRNNELWLVSTERTNFAQYLHVSVLPLWVYNIFWGVKICLLPVGFGLSAAPLEKYFHFHTVGMKGYRQSNLKFMNALDTFGLVQMNWVQICCPACQFCSTYNSITAASFTFAL